MQKEYSLEEYYEKTVSPSEESIQIYGAISALGDSEIR